jgi:hypothetical protein
MIARVEYALSLMIGQSHTLIVSKHTATEVRHKLSSGSHSAALLPARHCTTVQAIGQHPSHFYSWPTLTTSSVDLLPRDESTWSLVTVV